MSEYKRFTRKVNGRYVQYSITGCYNDMNGKGDYTTGDSVEKFAELEDKIESGQLVELPFLIKVSSKYAVIVDRDKDGRLHKTHTYNIAEAEAYLIELQEGKK